MILIFKSATEALNAEEVLEDANVPFQMVPIPKHLHRGCGFALEVPADWFHIAQEILRDDMA